MYSRRLDEKVLTFGVSGKLWRNALVMYDHETGSLWSHFTGECIEGRLNGRELERIRSIPRVKWGVWKRIHPDTRVLSIDGREDLERDAYEEYHRSDKTGLFGNAHKDDRLGEKPRVIGVWDATAYAAVPLSSFGEIPMITGRLGERSILVYYDGRSGASAAWYLDPAINPADLVYREGAIVTDHRT